MFTGRNTPRVVLAFRYDDFSNWTDTTFERRVFDAFAGRGCALTVGVVPFECVETCEDPGRQRVVKLRDDKVEVLRRLPPELFEVALHGYAHAPSGHSPLGPSEFAGQPLERQEQWIREGSAALATAIGRNPVTFIPPWNRFDARTLEALRANRFRVLAAGRRGPALNGPPTLLPETSGVWALESALETASSDPEQPAVVLTLFHAYDFREQNEEWGRGRIEDLISLLDSIRSRDDVRTVTLANLVERVPDLDGERYAAFVRYHVSRAHAYLPPRLARGVPEALDTYREPERSRRLRRDLIRRAVAFYGVVAMAAGVAGWSLSSLLSRSGSTVAATVGWLAPLFALVLFVYAVRDRQLGYRARLVLIGGAAAIVGFLLGR